MHSCFYASYHPQPLIMPLQTLSHPFPYPELICYYPFFQPFDAPFVQPTTEDDLPLSKEEIIKSEDTEVKQPEKATRRHRYPKKNVESNVVNQCYSYLTTRSKSLSIITRLLGSKDKITKFYLLMKQGRKKQSKYMGRDVLENLIRLEDDHPVYILHQKLRCKEAFKIHDLRRVIRIAVSYFLENVLPSAILTSSKLARATVKEHIARSRAVSRHLFRKTQLTQ